MSTPDQLAIALKLTADASQYTATMQGAGKTAVEMGQKVQIGTTGAATGMQSVVVQTERVAPAMATAAQATQQLSQEQNQAAQSAQALSSSQAKLHDSIGASNRAHAAGAISAGQHAQAMRMLPVQMTDVAVSLASGMPVWMVAIQQGGQLKDSFGGAGEAAKAMGGYVLGLLNPLTVGAAAVAVLGAAAYSGSEETRGLQNAIINSGNAAGVTSGQLMGMAAGVDAVAGTQGRAVEVLSAFVATGRVGAQNMEAFTAAAIRFEEVGGSAAEDTVKAFADLGKAPLDASLKLNESMHYLTASTYAQIKALMEQGRTTEAADVAQKAFADTINSRAGQMETNLGLVEKGWKGIKWAVSEAWDALKAIGRDGGPEAALQSIEAELAKMKSGKYAWAFGMSATDRKAAIAEREQEVNALRQSLKVQKDVSSEQANQVKLASQLADWEKAGSQYATAKQKQDEEIARTRVQGQALINAGKLTERQLEERIAAIKERNADKTVAGDSELANIKARVAAESQNLTLLQRQGLHYDKLNDGERTALQLAEQLNGTLDAKARKSKEAQLVQARLLADVLNQQEAERQLLEAKSAAQVLDKKLTTQQVGQYQQSIDQLINGNEQLRQEIDLVGKDVAAKREYVSIKAQEVITAKELEVINLRNAGARDEVIAKAEQELRLLRDKAALTATVNGADDGQAAKEMLDALTRETAALAMTNEQRQVAIALRELEAKGIKAGSEAYDEYIPKIRAAITNKAVVERDIETWQSIESTAHDVWTSVADSGVNAFERIGRTLKSAVLDALWQMTGRQWLISIGTAMGVPGASIAGQTAASAGTSALGNMTSSAVGSSLFSGASMTSMGQYFATGAMNTLVGTGAATGATAGAAIGGANGVAMQIGAYAPYAAAAVAALAAVGAFRTTKTVGGGLTGTLGDGDINAYDLRRKSGYLFGGPSYSVSDKGVAEQSAALQDAYAAMRTATAGMAEQLGIGSDSIKTFTTRLGNDLIHPDTGGYGIKFDGLTSEQAAAKVQDALDAANDQLARLVLGTTDYADKGETANQTLARLSNSLVAVNSISDTLGFTLRETSLAGADTASTFASLFGGVDAMATATASYYEAYYSQAERNATTTRQLTTELASLGVALPATRDEYRALVDGAMTSGNEALAASLLKLSPVFATITASADDLAVQSAQAAQEVASAATDLRSAFAVLLQPLLDAVASARQDVAVAVGTVAGLPAPTLQQLRDQVAAQQVTLPSAAGVTGAKATADAAYLRLTDTSTAASVYQRQADSTSAALQAAAAQSAATAAAFGTTKANIVAADAAENAAFAKLGYAYAGGFSVSAEGKPVWSSTEMNGQSRWAKSLGGGWNASLGAYEGPAALAAMRGGTPAQWNDYWSSMGTSGTPTQDPNAPWNRLDALGKQFGTDQAAVTKAQAAQNAATAALAAASAKLASATAANAQAQSAVDTATAAQAKAQADYAAALRGYVADASKAVNKLGDLREKTVAYFEAQKQLADGMLASIQHLRTAAQTMRYGQLSTGQTLALQQAEFAQAYSLALSTTGTVQAGYADKMAALLPSLSEAVRASTSSRTEWAVATAGLYAQSQRVANSVAANVPQDYQAESLAVLGQIDGTLAAIEAATSSAEKIISDAIFESGGQTLAGLRGVIAAIKGESIPAFATGAAFSGGVVSRPTVFNAGLMAEAGPEAIVPLTNIGGQLGVRMAGTGQAAVVAELRATRAALALIQAELAGLRSLSGETALAARRMARDTKSWSLDGLVVKNRASEPLFTQTVAA